MNDATGTRLGHLRRLLAHLEWANARVVGVLESQPASAVSTDAVRLFAHVLGAERGWISRVRGEEGPVQPWPSLSLADLRPEMERNAADLEALFRDLDEEALSRLVEYETTAGVAHRTPLADILTHVAMHGAYHRGQVAWALRHGGAEPVGTDFITMAREGRE